jgi:hypothetical protein
MRTTGVRVPPAGPGARRMLSYRPSGRHERALRRKSAPHPSQGTPRPWLNRREHRSTKPGSAGSSPAGRAVSEAEAVDAPGCGPGGSGFEPRRTPHSTTTTPYDDQPLRRARRPPAAGPSYQQDLCDRASYQSTTSTRGPRPIGRGSWLRTRRFGVRIPGAAPHDRPMTTPRSPDLAARGRAHWKGGGTT